MGIQNVDYQSAISFSRPVVASTGATIVGGGRSSEAPVAPTAFDTPLAAAGQADLQVNQLESADNAWAVSDTRADPEGPTLLISTSSISGL